MDEPVTSKRCLFLRAKLAVFHKQLVILNPGNVDAHMDLGDASYGLEKYEEAITAYKEAIKLQPNNSLCHYNLAKTYLKVGKRDLASEEYKILKTLDRKLAKELENLISKGSKKLKLIGNFLLRKP